jgi:hypothetical protein
MTVAELLRRMSSAEITDWMAHDHLDRIDDRAPSPGLTARRAMAYDRLETKLDAMWAPE